MSNQVPQWTKGDRLAKARHAAGYDMEEMGRLLGVHRQTVGAYERDEREPRRSTLIAWALTCGVDLEWLEHGMEPEGKASEGADTKAANAKDNVNHSYLFDLRARRYCPKVQVLADAA